MVQDTDKGSQFPNEDSRLAVARANDNGGTWHRCTSPYSPTSLHKLLERQDVSSILKNTIGGVLGETQLYERTGQLYIQIQPTKDNEMWQVEAALSDYGVMIKAKVPTVPEEDR